MRIAPHLEQATIQRIWRQTSGRAPPLPQGAELAAAGAGSWQPTTSAATFFQLGGRGVAKPRSARIADRAGKARELKQTALPPPTDTQPRTAAVLLAESWRTSHWLWLSGLRIIITTIHHHQPS
jgi:hypothetical protein